MVSQSENLTIAEILSHLPAQRSFEVEYMLKTLNRAFTNFAGEKPDQKFYDQAIALPCKKMRNIKSTHDGVFAEFRTAIQPHADVTLIGAALDGLQQAHHRQFTSGFNGDTTWETAVDAFLADPEKYRTKDQIAAVSEPPSKALQMRCGTYMQRRVHGPSN